MSGTSNTIGEWNSFFGYNSGMNNSTGESNTLIGYQAGFNISTGSRNLCLGVNAGPDPIHATSSDRLYIDNQTTSDPLIYGDFNHDMVKIHGQHEIHADPGITDGFNLNSYAEVIINEDATAGGDVMALKVDRSGLNNANNFISFFNGENNLNSGSGRLLGEVQASTNGLGIEYTSVGADYAEYLEASDHSQSFSPGEVVGVREGKISFNTSQADQVMVISTAPIIVGNTPYPSKDNWYKVAFIGQVDVRINGPVKSGDYIIPSGLEDGSGVAISSADIRIDQIPNVIGRSWETNLNASDKIVKVVVGLDVSTIYRELVVRQEEEIDSLKSDVQFLKKIVTQISQSTNMTNLGETNSIN